jgi:uncharacterized membrane protein YsdA (DUF1294 family)
MSKTARTHLIILGVIALLSILFLVFYPERSAIFWWWLIWGVVTFLYYGYDKRQAQSGGWRVPESILLLLPVIGGFIGGWAGMYGLRHKTRHTRFLVVMIGATALNLLVFFWLQGGMA